jgi:hypothetical protein
VALQQSGRPRQPSRKSRSAYPQHCFHGQGRRDASTPSPRPLRGRETARLRASTPSVASRENVPRATPKKVSEKERERVAEVVALRRSRLHSLQMRDVPADDVRQHRWERSLTGLHRIRTRSNASGRSPRPPRRASNCRVLRETRQVAIPRAARHDRVAAISPMAGTTTSRPSSSSAASIRVAIGIASQARSPGARFIRKVRVKQRQHTRITIERAKELDLLDESLIRLPLDLCRLDHFEGDRVC